ncbi:hypothetical protein SSBR45R_57030 [Bradyrhizobium sp. SSBR45R]|nr:hypothetical protein SSBR45R_57030 [Bradyrhizobium sp. SSBR45R]
MALSTLTAAPFGASPPSAAAAWAVAWTTASRLATASIGIRRIVAIAACPMRNRSSTPFIERLLPEIADAQPPGQPTRIPR